MGIALFDLDGTIINGDSNSLFMKCLKKHGLSPTIKNTNPNEPSMLQQFFDGTLDIFKYYEMFLSSIKGYTLEELEPIINEYLNDYLKPNVYQESLDLIREYKRKHHKVIIVSATTEIIVRPIATRVLEADDFISTRAVFDENGRITGTVYPDISHQEGKVKRLKALCQEKNYDLTDSHGYGDSINDLPMLEYVTHPHIVNAHPTLLKIGKDRGWDIIDFKS